MNRIEFTTEDGKKGYILDGIPIMYTSEELSEQKGLIKKKEIKVQVIKEERIVLEDKQKLAFDLCMGDNSLIISGLAGSGKSTVIKEVIKELKKKKKNVAVLSTTGISATLLDSGSTFHSFFSIMPQKVLTEKNIVTVKPNKAKMWAAISHVIIDEMSMLRADTFDLAILNLIHNDCDYTKIKWIFLGDFLQLQCILQKDEKPHFHYKGLDFRYSNHFKNLNVKEIELTQVRRQSDPQFISALNKVRVGEYTDFFKQFENVPEKEDAVYIAATNKLVDIRNKEKLDEIKSDLIIFEGQVSPKFNPKDFQVSKTIEVKDGCKIMYLINDKNTGLCNGDKGFLKIIIKDNKIIPYFVSDRLKITIALNPHVFETKEYKLIGKTIELVTKDFIEQYPIKLAYAISVHRSQGSTFDSIILDKTAPFFAANMEYVGLSRCKYKEGLCIITKK
jgi:ATP-dependent exoDNAse (exonuclease V) alpha subunit